MVPIRARAQAGLQEAKGAAILALLVLAALLVLPLVALLLVALLAAIPALLLALVVKDQANRAARWLKARRPKQTSRSRPTGRPIGAPNSREKTRPF